MVIWSLGLKALHWARIAAAFTRDPANRPVAASRFTRDGTEARAFRLGEARRSASDRCGASRRHSEHVADFVEHPLSAVAEDGPQPVHVPFAGLKAPVLKVAQREAAHAQLPRRFGLR